MDDACSTQGAESTTHITKAQSQSRDDDLGPQLNGTIWLLTTLAALFLGLRIYCKLLRRRGLWWDDYFLLASWVALAVSAIMLSVGVSLGLGKHNNDINPETFQGVVMFSYIAGFCSVLATAWSKTSFAITLLRISNGWVKMFVWFTIITVNLVLGANGTIQWAQCWPVTKLWDASVPGKCLPSEVVKDYNTFVSAYSGAMDIVLALLPWKIIWGTTMHKREKLGALFAMSMGVFAGITSFLKITTLSAIGNDDIATTVVLFIYGTAEGAVTIMAASIPILRALLRQDKPFSPARFLRLSEGQQARSPTSHDKPDGMWPDEKSKRSSLESITLEKREGGTPWI